MSEVPLMPICSVSMPSVVMHCVTVSFQNHRSLPVALHMTDDGGAKLGKRARKRPDTLTAHTHIERLKKPKVDKVDQPAASAGSRRKNDKPKGKSKQKNQTGSRRQLHNGHVKTKAITLSQPKSLLQPEGLRRSERLKRKAEGMEDDAETDIASGQPNKRACMAVTAVRMDEEQPGAVFSADAALGSECSNARQKTVGRGAAKNHAQNKHTTRRRVDRTSGLPVTRNVPHSQ